MKATAKHKAVTSGRLTGGAKVQPPRRQVNPGPPARPPEPAYSLYSTDPEEQVTTLHQGLDRCAALLSGILQADTTEASPRLHRAGTCGAAKSRPPTSLGKKSIKKVPKKTAPVHKNPPSGQRGAGSTAPTPQSPTPAAHSGVKLHPTLRRVHTKAHHSPYAPPPQPQTSTPPPHTSVLLSVHQSSSQPPPGQTECLSSDEQEFVPVRDTDTQRAATDAAAGHTPSYPHSCTTKVSDMHLEPGLVQEVPQDAHSREMCSAGEEVKEKTVQYLLGELKALITGQGSVAERLLHHLEQAVSSPLLNDGGLNIHTESAPDLLSLHDHNLQLRRRVRILNQQLKEKEKAERDTESNLEVTILQEEVTTAQCRLRELQHDLAELRKDLQDTQSQLRGREAENAAVRTDLEATRSRLVDAERQKSEWASLAQQRLEEIENLKRMLQSQESSVCSTVVESLPTTPHQPLNERVTQYLMSLGRFDPAPAEHMVAERERSTSDKPANTQTDQSQRLSEVQPCGRRLDATLSHCDVESLWSDCSMRSGSTFDTRDEAAFRDGLVALDASIASLQKTMQLDLRR